MRTFTAEQTLRLVFLAKIEEMKRHHRTVGDIEIANGWKEIFEKVQRGELLTGTDNWATDAFAWCWQHCRLGHDNYAEMMEKFFAPRPFEVGDIVEPVPDSGTWLRSGASQYDKAVVVAVKPTVLVSEGTDMMWSDVADMKLRVVGKVNDVVLKLCQRRLK